MNRKIGEAIVAANEQRSRLAEWVLDQIAADILAAQSVLNAGEDDAVAVLASWVEMTSRSTDAAMAHFDRHQPKHVIEDGSAKIQIVRMHAGGEHMCPSRRALNDGLWSAPDQDQDVMSPCPTLRLLALPYADRPGYREEWRP